MWEEVIGFDGMGAAAVGGDGELTKKAVGLFFDDLLTVVALAPACWLLVVLPLVLLSFSSACNPITSPTASAMATTTRTRR